MMEYWNTGILEYWNCERDALNPLFHHSNFPSFCHSNIPAFLEECFLFDGHFARSLSRPLVLISVQVKNAVDHEEDQHLHRIQAKSIGLASSCLYRNGQVTQKMGMQGRALSLPHREGKDIGRFVSMEVSTIQFLNLDIIDQQDTEFGIRKCQFG
jgi:hypothetical protein